jgi:hypothetical protein
MSESLQSVLIGQSPLYGLIVVALIFTAARPIRAGAGELRSLARIFLAGIACQCVHLIEELVTGFHHQFPRLLGLADWSAEFFVAFNVVWLALWALSAAAVDLRMRASLFPMWFFAFGMVGNAIWHPLFAVAKGGYFPGLFTSPLVGAAGVVVLRRLFAATGVDRGSSAGLKPL